MKEFLDQSKIESIEIEDVTNDYFVKVKEHGKYFEKKSGEYQGLNEKVLL